MSDLYLSGEYAEKNPTYHIEDSPFKAKQILKMVNKHGLPNGSVCDFGCGAGEVLRQLQLRFPSETLLHGYEISPQGFALAKERENRTMKFFCEDLLSIKVPPYDLLLCVDVVEHVEDYVGLLRELRPKGTYKIFHVPLDLSVQSVLRSTPLKVVRATVGHIHYFSKETALMTLEDAGYEIVDWFYTPSALALRQDPKAKLLKWPRRIVSMISPDLAVRIFGGYSILVLAK